MAQGDVFQRGEGDEVEWIIEVHRAGEVEVSERLWEHVYGMVELFVHSEVLQAFGQFVH